MDQVEASHIVGKPNEVHDEVETSSKHQTTERENIPTKELQVLSYGLIPVDQLKKFIMWTIKDKFDGSSKVIFGLHEAVHPKDRWTEDVN